jgi:RNA-directed DNA polymerase
VIIARIARSAGLDATFLARVVRTANHRYKMYAIPKKTGGLRTISHPAKELKFIQRWLVDNLFVHLPVHKSVYSYKERVGIRDHALIHAKQNYLLRVDFENFFPSIVASDISDLLQRNRDRLPFKLYKQDIDIICAVVCKDGGLTIGAPSSPILSNAVMFPVDKYWSGYCKRRGVFYTRYADDLYFSTRDPDVLARIYRELDTYIRKIEHPRLHINRQKTVFTSKKRKRHVTGLVLTSTNKVSIGRKKKRWIRSLVHQFVENQLTGEQVSYLRGYLSFVKAVEPSFYKNTEAKYGKATLRAIYQSGAEIVE